MTSLWILGLDFGGDHNLLIAWLATLVLRVSLRTKKYNLLFTLCQILSTGPTRIHKH